MSDMREKIWRKPTKNPAGLKPQLWCISPATQSLASVLVSTSLKIQANTHVEMVDLFISNFEEAALRPVL